MASAADCNALLSALKRLGGSAGNGRLREALGWPEERYWAAQTALLDAGALISGGADTADAKLAVMEECGFKVTRNPSEMGRLLKSLL